MKFSAVREKILPVVQAAARVAPARAVQPIYSHLQMSLDGNTLSVLGGDGDAVVHARLDVKKETGGQMLLPAQTVVEICQHAPQGSEIEFSLQDGKVTIQAEKSRFLLAALQEEFPTPEVVDGISIQIPADKLHWLLDKTYCCMAATDFRNYLMGTLLHLDENGLHVVATDTHRLALAEWKDGKNPGSESIQAIVPRRSVGELIRLLDAVRGGEDSQGESKAAAQAEDKTEEKTKAKPKEKSKSKKSSKAPQATVTLGEQQVRFDIGDMSLQTSLIRGRYPEYGRVIPDNSKGKVLELNAENLQHSLKRATVILQRSGTVEWKIGSAEVQLTSQNEKGERTEQQLPAKFSGKDAEISFNINYQIEIMEKIDGEQVHMVMFSDTESISLIDPAQPDLYYVLMPLRQ